MTSKTEPINSSTALKHLKSLADPKIAAHSQRFFKTGPGEYCHGDKFLGIRVPVLRKEARAFRQLTIFEAVKLLKSRWHEVRLFALIVLVNAYQKGDEATRQRIYDRYLQNSARINNWDLVDSSAHQIVGGQLLGRDRSMLYELADSECLWERRIAIIACYHFIKKNDFDDTLRLAEMLLDDQADLMHKAVGWMLREVGNRDRSVEEAFLLKHYRRMPRTMLRYAIEKFPETQRQAYLKGTA